MPWWRGISTIVLNPTDVICSLLTCCLNFYRMKIVDDDVDWKQLVNSEENENEEEEEEAPVVIFLISEVAAIDGALVCPCQSCKFVSTFF